MDSVLRSILLHIQIATIRKVKRMNKLETP
jgi:hypothetical protein